MKHESSIFKGLKVMAKVHAANADADADTDGRAMTLAPGHSSRLAKNTNRKIGVFSMKKQSF